MPSFCGLLGLYPLGIFFLYGAICMVGYVSTCQILHHVKTQPCDQETALDIHLYSTSTFDPPAAWPMLIQLNISLSTKIHDQTQIRTGWQVTSMCIQIENAPVFAHLSRDIFHSTKIHPSDVSWWCYDISGVTWCHPTQKNQGQRSSGSAKHDFTPPV